MRVCHGNWALKAPRSTEQGGTSRCRLQRPRPKVMVSVDEAGGVARGARLL